MTPGPGDSVGVNGLAVVDFGSPPDPSNPYGPPGPPDGHLDIVVTAQSRSGVGSASVIMLAGEVDDQGNFEGFGDPITLAQVGKAGNIATGDFTGDGATDLAVTDTGGVTVIYGQPLTVPSNSTSATARDLGSVAHLVTQPQAIVSGHEDAYFTYDVPTEAVAGSGDEVIDFSALFQDVQGAGLEMDVTDAKRRRAWHGRPVPRRGRARRGADGPRFRPDRARRDARRQGVYTLDIDVLPQVISAQAESVLPGGPATSIVLTLQGDRLDPTAASDPANYTVLWLAPPGPGGTSPTPTAIVPDAVDGASPVVYDPSANVDVASGLTYQTAVRQTVTLLFSSPLPAGSYEIVLSPAIQAASYNTGESSLLAGDASFGGHPVVSVRGGSVVNGSDLTVPNLVAPAGDHGQRRVDRQGDAVPDPAPERPRGLLNQLLAQKGDDPSITAALNNEILARFAPAVRGGPRTPPVVRHPLVRPGVDRPPVVAGARSLLQPWHQRPGQRPEPDLCVGRRERRGGCDGQRGGDVQPGRCQRSGDGTRRRRGPQPGQQRELLVHRRPCAASQTLPAGAQRARPKGTAGRRGRWRERPASVRRRRSRNRVERARRLVRPSSTSSNRGPRGRSRCPQSG